MDTSQIGLYIKEKRKEKNMTQLDVALELNLSPQAVSKWERGECLPDISLLPEIAEILDITVEGILNCGKPKDETNIKDILAVINAFVDEELFSRIINEFNACETVSELVVPLDIFMFLNNEQKNILLGHLFELSDYDLIIDDIIQYFNNGQKEMIVLNAVAKKEYNALEILLPYLSKKTKTTILNILLENGEFEVIEDMLVFLNREQKDIIIQYAINSDGDDEFLENCLPFFDIKQRREIKKYYEENNKEELQWVTKKLRY